MRARIDVSEIEAQTKIRAKYLRALENEEWGLLPGPTSSRASCAPTRRRSALDGKALVEEYRLEHERPERRRTRADHLLAPAHAAGERSPPGPRGSTSRPSWR